MTSRDAILQRVRTELSKGPQVPLPPVAEVWPRENRSPGAMAERFAQELAAVHGEVIRCGSVEDARGKLAELVRQAGWKSVGAMDRPMVRGATAGLPPGVVRRAGCSPHTPCADSGTRRVPATSDGGTRSVPDTTDNGTRSAPDTMDWQPRQMAELSAGVIEAEALLADTGSCLIACPTVQDRLLCYLPPACVVLARVEQLAEHLPAAWAEISARAADPALRGELVIVTGPSRTSDIEKILTLGVHGPKRLIVILVGK